MRPPEQISGSQLLHPNSTESSPPRVGGWTIAGCCAKMIRGCILGGPAWDGGTSGADRSAAEAEVGSGLRATLRVGGRARWKRVDVCQPPRLSPVVAHPVMRGSASKSRNIDAPL